MNIGAIVQARMSSQRFPGKVLHPVNGKPLLMYIVERLRRVGQLKPIVVATSDNVEDRAVAVFCRDNGVSCYRGDLDNVVARFAGTLETYPMDVFVRVNGDSPLIDQRLIEKGIEIFLQGQFDMVTNVFPRSYPKGQSVEILSGKTFRRIAENIRDKDDREHVTRFFYNNSGEFHIYNIPSSIDLSEIQLSVDTKDDMRLFENIVSRMKRPHWEYNLEDVLELRLISQGEG